MWPPPDKNAFPSSEEISHAKKVINTLEDAIRDAFELVKTTNLRIAEMKRDVEERKAWIAPIRKVPTEVLVDILLHASEMEDLAPVKFTAVSRLWRDVILATPKAWSFIDLGRIYNRHVLWRKFDGYHGCFPGYKNTYFERSKPRLLHLSLPNIEGFYPKHSNSIIKEQSCRILCLATSTDTLSDTQYSSRCQQFPCLQILTVTDSRALLDTSFFSISRFPTLQTLHLPCYFSFGSSPIISPSSFPPLQHLTVDINSAGIDVLQSCAVTLRSLSIHCLHRDAPSAVLQITFPLLRCLTIGNYFVNSLPLVKAVTPVLTSLVTDNPQSSLPAFFDADMQKVTHMRLVGFEIPSVCTHVRVLQIRVNPRYPYTHSTTREYAECASKLKEIASAYPSLETIEVCNEASGYVAARSMQQTVEECLGEDFVKPKLLWTSSWQDDLPGYVAERCGWDMPCNY